MYRLNPALRSFWRKRARHKVLYGGRSSSKSHDAAGQAVYLAANYTLKFLCARQFQNRISESVYTLIKDKIENSEYKDEFILTNTSIRHKVTGSEFLFYGIARNLNEIKSTEGVDILWLEEAHYLTAEQWEVIEPTIRKEFSEIWIIFNPNEISDFVYQNFVVKPPEDSVVRHINFDENPFMSETMKKVIAAAKARDPEQFDHVYLGQPKTGGDKSVINLKFVLAAVDAHKKIPEWRFGGKKRLGFDVADDGEDNNAWVSIDGNIIDGAHEWEGLEDKLLDSSKLVWNEARLRGAAVNYDCIGVGAHVGSKFAEINEEHRGSFQLEYDAYNAGGEIRDKDAIFMKLPHLDIKNKDHYSNSKAQEWGEAATRFRKTYEYIEKGVKHPLEDLISIDSSKFTTDMLNQLCIELSTPRKDVDLAGRFKVESKPDMRKKRKIKSPNVADAAIMAIMKPKRAAAGFFDF